MKANICKKVSQEITSGISEMATSVNHINLAVNEVNEISRQNKDTSNTLVKDASRFKVDLFFRNSRKLNNFRNFTNKGTKNE